MMSEFYQAIGVVVFYALSVATFVGLLAYAVDRFYMGRVLMKENLQLMKERTDALIEIRKIKRTLEDSIELSQEQAAALRAEVDDE